MPGNHISEENIALYAMRSCTPMEMASIQQHLDACEECRSKLANVLGKLSLADLTVPQEPLPPDARDRFLRRFRDETAAKPSEEPPAAKASQETPRSGNWFGSLGWIAATAALLFAAYMGNTAHNLRQQLDAQRYQVVQLSNQVSRSQQVIDVLTSHKARHITLAENQATAQPMAHAIYEENKGELIFVVSNLHPVRENKTYELWLIPANGQAPIPAGLFRPDIHGSASVVLPPLPTGIEVKTFDVTIEDAQGAVTPTLPVVMSGQ